MRTHLRVGVAALGLTLLSSGAHATDYCTKEQYERDRHRITDALSKGTLVKGPERVRDSILISEDEWYKLNYPEQIALMQAYECFMGRGKQFLYLDVRSLSTGKLLATWKLGALEPTNGGHDPNSSGASQGDSGIGITGATRTDFIKSVIEGCRAKSASPTFCSCYGNALADSLSVEELKEASTTANREATMAALRPKLEAAAKRCQ